MEMPYTSLVIKLVFQRRPTKPAITRPNYRNMQASGACFLRDNVCYLIGIFLQKEGH